MFCKKCGEQNDDNAYKCVKCGEVLQQAAQSQQPAASVPNYLAMAILVTIFCCIPFGIPAIVFSSQVNGKLAGGDVAGAMESSRKAKMWTWIAFGAGLAGIVFYVLMMAFGVMAGL
jgi:uncharacterized membrane protein YvbJ